MRRHRQKRLAAALALFATTAVGASALAQEPAPPAGDEAAEPPAEDEAAEPPAEDEAPAEATPAPAPLEAGCVKDTDCKGERICEAGTCVFLPEPEGGGDDEPAEPDGDDEPAEWDRWYNGGNFMDTRITFVMSDDNLLAGTKERSPAIGFGQSNDELFFEGLQSEKRGWETETQLVLYKRMPSYFHRLDAEAALVLEMQNWVDEDTWENETRIGDDGSYLKLNWYTRRDDFEGDNVSLTLFPMDSQRFLLGYTYDLTWGGERIFPNKKGQVPGARLMYDFNVGQAHQGYLFLGAKTARLLNSDINEQQTYFGVLAGGGIDIVDWLHWDLNGGYFQRGPLLIADGTPLGGEPLESFGGSTRLVLHQGAPIANSVDFRLYKVSPDGPGLLAQKQKYDDGLDWSITGEFTYVAQTLVDFESFTDGSQDLKTVLQPAMAAAGNGKLRFGRLRVHADFIYRNLDYVVFNIPGVFPYKTVPENAQTTPEMFVAGGLDFFFERPRLTPGLIVGYKKPASVTVDGDTVVVRDQYDWQTLVPGDSAFDILSAKLSLKWDVAPFFVVAGELRYTHDQNRTKLVSSYDEGESEGYTRVYEDDNIVNRLGFALLAQAKW